ncbi:MAG: D-glycerate dehydrogenase [Patescibacteria group bacterium]|nr:D-glycerate dehydrogenase [Patescibacteria group bacterium]
MSAVFVTRRIPEEGLFVLREAGHEVVVSERDGVLTRDELLGALQEKQYDAVLCLLTDKVNDEVFDAAPNAKIFANYAVGFDNINLEEAKRRGVAVTNTPDVVNDTVAEHTIALMLSMTSRIAEGDRLVRAGKYEGWAPMLLLGTDMKGKMLGLLGAGRIGQRVAAIAHHGLRMRVIYYDIRQNPDIEKSCGASFRASVEDVLREADVVTVHVPLLDSTRHLINAERLALMKKSAYLVNTARGPIVDEKALVKALENKAIMGAGLDVFEEEPALAPGLAALENVVLTPHIASASLEARAAMARVAAENIIAVLSGAEPKNRVA